MPNEGTRGRAVKLTEYIDVDSSWDHGMDDPRSGVRVMGSVDYFGLYVLQIRCQDGRVASARLSMADLAELHRQASAVSGG